MLSRLVFAAIVSFWLVMNFLLWRSQWQGRSQIGNQVPLETVWQRILNAPDSSPLEIYDHDTKLGICRWSANSSLLSNKMLQQDYAPPDVNPTLKGYTLSVSGNTCLGSYTNRLRFEGMLTLTTNQLWQDLHIQASLRSNSWEIHGLAASKKLTIIVKGPEGIWRKRLDFSQLQDPESLLAEFGIPSFTAVPGLAKDSWAGVGQAMKWQGYEDHMMLGHSRIRVYRLESHFLGQKIDLFISRAGEIMLAEFPNQITLRNEALARL